jgi:hypothetical protein
MLDGVGEMVIAFPFICALNTAAILYVDERNIRCSNRYSFVKGSACGPSSEGRDRRLPMVVREG